MFPHQLFYPNGQLSISKMDIMVQTCLYKLKNGLVITYFGRFDSMLALLGLWTTLPNIIGYLAII
jgi:hypothetical protein